MKTISLSAIMIMSMLLPACKKPTLPNYAINADLKANFNYLQGSYWIYKDSISGRIDSFCVVSNISGRGTYTGFYTQDFIAMNIIEYNTTIITDTVPWTLNLIYDEADLSFENKSTHFSGQTISYTPLLNYPLQIGVPSSLHPSNDLPGIINISPTYTLNGQSFTNVAEITQSFSIDNVIDTYSYHDLFYVNADAFIIKMSLNHPQDSLYRVWELQRYHINK